MPPSTASTYIPYFQINSLFGRSSNLGFSPKVWAERIHGLNHPAWILSHILGVRRAIARNLGIDTVEPEKANPRFGDPCLPAAEYGDPEAMVTEFVGLGDAIAARLAELDDAVLAQPFSPAFPDGRERTIAEALPFLICHEGLHLGQMSLIRKMHDLKPIAETTMEMMKKAQG